MWTISSWQKSSQKMGHKHGNKSANYLASWWWWTKLVRRVTSKTVMTQLGLQVKPQVKYNCFCFSNVTYTYRQTERWKDWYNNSNYMYSVILSSHVTNWWFPTSNKVTETDQYTSSSHWLADNTKWTSIITLTTTWQPSVMHMVNKWKNDFQ